MIGLGERDSTSGKGTASQELFENPLPYNRYNPLQTCALRAFVARKLLGKIDPIGRRMRKGLYFAFRMINHAKFAEILELA